MIEEVARLVCDFLFLINKSSVKRPTRLCEQSSSLSALKNTPRTCVINNPVEILIKALCLLQVCAQEQWRQSLRAALVAALEEWWFALKLPRKSLLEEQPLLRRVWFSCGRSQPELVWVFFPKKPACVDTAVLSRWASSNKVNTWHFCLPTWDPLQLHSKVVSLKANYCKVLLLFAPFCCTNIAM